LSYIRTNTSRNASSSCRSPHLVLISSTPLFFPDRRSSKTKELGAKAGEEEEDFNVGQILSPVQKRKLQYGKFLDFKE